MADDRCSVRLTRRYAASPTEVWSALTDAESMSRWLARPRRLDLSQSGAIQLELPDETRIAGSVRQVDPGRLLEIEWCYPGEESSVVRLELSSDGEDTLLVLDHQRIEEPFGMRYMARWSLALERFAQLIDR